MPDVASTSPNRHRSGGGTVWLAALLVTLSGGPAAAGETPAQVLAAAAIDGSRDVRDLLDWVKAARDNHGLPFMIVDKADARVIVFDRQGEPAGAAAALLGLGKGDDSVPGIGQRRLADIAPAERTTPAGRFEASLGNDLEQDVLWIDYQSALSLHRVIVGTPRDHRAARLASPTPLDNRISFGCINVPAAFFDRVVLPAFTGTVGIVYILPETRPLRSVFPLRAPLAR
jgi:hypothetical protein